jgi:hypothetical protein
MWKFEKYAFSPPFKAKRFAYELRYSNKISHASTKELK